MNTKLSRLFYLLLVTSVIFIYTGCKDDNPTEPVPQINESELLVKYFEENGDFINTSCPAMITATDLYNGMLTQKDWPVLDVRAAADYQTGHIEGAVNVPLADIANYYKNNNLQTKEKVILACYSGQSAAWGTSILRLMGFTNVFDLKFGMCSWNSQFAGSWRNAIGNGRATEFVTENFPKPATGQLPVLNTGKQTGGEILTARLEAMLAEGFSQANVTNAVLFQNLGDYFIINYWSVEHYNMGHITGAMQYTPKVDLKLAQALKTLPTDKPIVVYCYTGQTSAHVAAFLRALGYNAKSLQFGTNAMNYDNMPGTKWTESECMDYPIVN